MASPKAKKAKKAKRGRKHPGVTLIQPKEEQRIGWRMRYVSPDSGKTVYESLDRALTTQEQREKEAVRKSKELDKRRLELAMGATRETGTKLEAAIKRYFEDHPQLRERTRDIYRNAADKLETWAKENKVKTADELTRGKLTTFRAQLVKEPKRTAVKGGKRGERVTTGEPRSAAAVNQELRAVRTVLGYLRELELLSKLNNDDLRDSLKKMSVTRDEIQFLSVAQCKQLMEAALKHDAEKFAETRDEHTGKKEKGTTARYTPIAPFTFFMLMTGARASEALTLEWSSVDLNTGAGAIRLSSRSTKTKQGRSIWLGVSPMLRALLLATPEAERVGKVFKFSYGEADAAAERMRSKYGAPRFTWQTLRRTAAVFLTNSNVFDAASAYRSAKQLGHSVVLAEKVYTVAVHDISPDARTLEDAMQIADVVAKLLPADETSEAAQ